MNNVHGIDDLTVEEWKQINSIMSKKMKLTNRETFMFYELENTWQFDMTFDNSAQMTSVQTKQVLPE